SVQENAGAATITVTRSGVTTAATTVQFATSDGTAVAGTDYTTSTGTGTFAAGVTSQTFTVPVIDTGLVTPNKTLDLTLSNAAGGASVRLGSLAAAVLT